MLKAEVDRALRGTLVELNSNHHDSSRIVLVVSRAYLVAAVAEDRLSFRAGRESDGEQAKSPHDEDR